MGKSAWTETGTATTIGATTSTVDATASSSPDYLSNSDKITLMQNYATELATKTSLDTTAASLSCSTTAYDAAVAAINTTLINAGATATWATTWPDGKIFGPVVGIKTMLSQDWAAISTQRTALQSAISAAQAAASESAAISAAATNVITKLNAMALTSPSSATWASTSKPTLPNSNYAAGSCWLSTDGFEYQVNADGTSWEVVTVAATGLFGKIVTSQLTVANFDNLVPNPTSELGSAVIGVVPEGNGLVADGNAYAGTWCRKATNTNLLYATGFIPVNAGDHIYLEAQVKAPYGTCVIGIRWAKADGSDSSILPYSELPEEGSEVYVLRSVTGICPSDAVFFRIYFQSLYANGGYAYFDNFYCRRMADANLIVDGTITASKLVAGAAVVDIERVGSLTANVIYFSDGFCLNTLEPKEAGADKTLSHIATSVQSLSANVSTNGTTPVAAPGLSWTVPVQATSDVVNISASLLFISASSTATSEVWVYAVVDGNTASPSASQAYFCPNSSLFPLNASFFASITGLSAGSHTIALYIVAPASNATGSTLVSTLTANHPVASKGSLQHIY